MVERLSDFAFVKSYIDGGRLLSICGQDYNAWFYDWYVFDAISLASRWKPEEVSFDRIIHLRCWIRENTQHAHDLDYSRLRSMTGAKRWIDSVIRAEYGLDHDFFGIPEYEVQMLDVLRRNAEIFN